MDQRANIHMIQEKENKSKNRRKGTNICPSASQIAAFQISGDEQPLLSKALNYPLALYQRLNTI